MTIQSLTPNPAPTTRRRPTRRALPRWSKFAGGAILVLVVSCAALAPLLAPADPAAQSLTGRLLPPMSTDDAGNFYVLGTDGLGRDLLSRIIYGARTSVTVGVISVLVAAVLGITIGCISGYRGGLVDNVIMRITDMMISFPTLILAMFVLFVVGPSPIAVIAVLALSRWMVYARVSRAQVLGVSQEAYVFAARAMGRTHRAILWEHVLPNIRRSMVALVIVEFAVVVLAEASLSFLGLGIQPPGTSWGLIVAESRNFVTTAWWLFTFPGLAITATVLALYAISSPSKSGR
jgi:peptide/nickel transport system permease protein